MLSSLQGHIPLSGMGSHATVVVDPPWPLPAIGWSRHKYKRKLDYPTMSLDELKALPVADVLADDAFVYLWVVNKFFHEAFDIMAAWQVEYWFVLTWVKSGGTQFPGSPCFNSEWCLVGRKGKPQFLDTRAFPVASTWPRRKHSEKPEEFYDLLRRVSPQPRLDIFGRREIAGFASWGNEISVRVPPPDHWQLPLVE